MTAMSKLQSILNLVVKRKESFSKTDAVSVMYDIDNLVMTQKLSISAALHLSEASDMLKQVRVLIENDSPKKEIQALLDRVVLMIQTALKDAVGGRGTSDPSRN